MPFLNYQILPPQCEQRLAPTAPLSHTHPPHPRVSTGVRARGEQGSPAEHVALSARSGRTQVGSTGRGGVGVHQPCGDVSVCLAGFKGPCVGAGGQKVLPAAAPSLGRQSQSSPQSLGDPTHPFAFPPSQGSSIPPTWVPSRRRSSRPLAQPLWCSDHPRAQPGAHDPPPPGQRGELRDWDYSSLPSSCFSPSALRLGAALDAF